LCVSLGTGLLTLNRKTQTPKLKKQDFVDHDSTWTMEEDAFIPLKLSSKEQEELLSKREAQAAMASHHLEKLELRSHVMLPGDYQMQVHIIECRDLKGGNSNGLCDAYARVRVMGRIKKTRVIRKVSGCVFDDTLYFNFTGLTCSAIEEAGIELQVYDFDAFLAHKLIGMATFDARSIHALPNHEFYRKWVGLINNKARDSSGYHGFIKVSLTILGPGDEQLSHDLDAEYQKELAEEADQSSGFGIVALEGPNIDVKTTFLVVFVWEARDLSVMDSTHLFSSARVEAYVRVDFSGMQAMTSVVSVLGRANLAPEFNEELWLPITEPTETRRISVGLWNYSAHTQDRPIAHVYFDLDDVRHSGDLRTSQGLFGWAFAKTSNYMGPRPRWHCLYGAPAGIQGKRGALQNRYGEEASTYRGQLLLSMEILTNPPSNLKHTARRTAFRFKPTLGLTPPTAKYHLRALALMGSEIPQFRSAGIRTTTKMRLVISIGNHELNYGWEQNKRGVVVWNKLLTLKAIRLPVLIEEIPDVCVYLVRGPPKVSTVCFSRIPAARVLQQQFRGGPYWEMLKPEPSGTTYPSGMMLDMNPGAILLKLGFGLSEDAMDPAFSWPEVELMKKVEERTPFCLRVYIYQAKDLPASDENGLLDPYIKVRFCGKKEKTRVHSTTTSPLFYETLEFHEMLPVDIRFGPDIIVQVWDRDIFSSRTPKALLRLPLTKCPVLSSESSKPPLPTWHKLTTVGAVPLSSAILMSAALIRKRDLAERFSRSGSITPQMRQAWVEVTCVGVRQLKAHRLRTPQAPYVRIDVPAPNERGTNVKTRSSSVPCGRNANFLERKIMAVEMPENALYAQHMDLRVYDAHIGLSTGLQNPLVGACSIDLATKMPWNSEDFVPPQMELFSDSDLWRQKEEKQQDSNLRTQAEFPEGIIELGTGKFAADVDLGFCENGYREIECDDYHELERRDDEFAAFTSGDAGTGAFNQLTLSGLPMIYEDVVYMREQDQLAQNISREGRPMTFLDAVDSQISSAAEALTSLETSYKLSELPISFPSQWAAADYIEGREWWTEQNGRELENYLRNKPFESYKVFRGKYHQNAAKSTLRCVGVFKGILRILDANPAFEEKPFFPMRVLASSAYTVRLYVIRGMNLQPVDGNSSDPYLRVKLGSDVEDRKSSHCTRTLKPDFYDTFEFHTVLPGPSTLKIQVKEWNRIYPVHEIIGQTEIDLEDRWFHSEWQKLDSLRKAGMNKLKPIEIRNLHKDTSPLVQGQLHLWLEIRPESETHREPPVELRGPEKRKFEVRVICWKSKDVPFEMGDYFAEFWIGEYRKQKTDVHWRCRNGQGSWNWRIKIPVELPLDSPEKGRLVVQLWDQDIIKWNEVVGDAQIDLYRWFLKAYHEKRAINIFKDINEAIARKQSLRSGEDSNQATESNVTSQVAESPLSLSLVESAEDETALLDTNQTKGAVMGSNHLQDHTGHRKYQTAEKDAQYFVKQLKELVGLGEIDESTRWIKMTYHDVRTNRLTSRGSLAISIEILPDEEVELRPAGHGRSEPNANPYLPPTTGRMTFSYNPLALCSALLGPKLAFQVFCCLCCILILVVIGLGGVYFTSFYTLLESLGLAQ